MSDLVGQLKSFAAGCRGSMWQSRDRTIALCDEAAAEIAALQARIDALVEAAAWAFRRVKHMPMDEASQADFAQHLATIAAMKGGRDG